MIKTKKTIFAVLLCCALLLICADMQSYAEQMSVQFTGNEMKSNFSSEDLFSLINTMEPGDNITADILLINSSDKTVVWYMHNETIKTMEQSRESAFGGLYAYKLVYDKDGGNTKVLYDSEVGGEDQFESGGNTGEGLDLINARLKDYFYLDEFVPGQEAHVKIIIGLDGETQGDGYQNTFANISAQFAVEPVVNTVTSPSSGGGLYSSRPKTGDYNAPELYILLFLSSCCALFVLRNKRIRATVLTLILLVVCFIGPLSAQSYAEQYQYIVSVSPGKIGKDNGIATEKLLLNKGETANLNYILKNVSTLLEQKQSKYYVKGLRISGHDNTIEDPDNKHGVGWAPEINEDITYTIWYGVKGRGTSYTINYVDDKGNRLIEPQSYYGNIGDKPLVTYTYIDGYKPSNAVNQTKTLSENPAENIFTFSYVSAKPASPQSAQGQTGGAVNNTGVITNGAGNNNISGEKDNTVKETSEPISATLTKDNENNKDNTEKQLTEAQTIPTMLHENKQTESTNTPQPKPTNTPEIKETPVPSQTNPVEILDLDIPEHTQTFELSETLVPLATLYSRAKDGDTKAQFAFVAKIFVYVLMVLALVIGLYYLITSSKQKRLQSVNVQAGNHFAQIEPFYENDYENNNPTTVTYDPDIYDVSKLYT